MYAGHRDSVYAKTNYDFRCYPTNTGATTGSDVHAPLLDIRETQMGNLANKAYVGNLAEVLKLNIPATSLY